jgi:hypothetical protein
MRQNETIQQNRHGGSQGGLNNVNVLKHLASIGQLAREMDLHGGDATPNAPGSRGANANDNNGSSSESSRGDCSVADLALFDEGQEKLNFCHVVNDCLAFSRNVAVTCNFDLLDKDALMNQHRDRLRKAREHRTNSSRFGLRRRRKRGRDRGNFIWKNCDTCCFFVSLFLWL